VNVSQLRYEDTPGPPFDFWDPGWRGSFTGGADIEFPLNDRLSIMTGPRYVRQTNNVKLDPASGLTGEFHLTQDYISLPALVAIRPLNSRRLFLDLGPELGVLIGANIFTDYTFSGGAVHTEDDITNDLNDVNVTLDAGLGIDFPMAEHVGVAAMRYTHGLVGIAKQGHWGTDWKTQGVEFLLGYRW
jgi:hypothetical protein